MPSKGRAAATDVRATQTDLHPLAPTPRLALTRAEAAAALAMSLDSFERYCQPNMRLVRIGRMRLVPVTELDRWLREHADAVLPEGGGRRG